MAKAGAGAPISSKWGGAALALGLAFVLTAGEAAAQCAGAVVTGHTGSIWCDRSGTSPNLHINLRDPAISTTFTAGFGAGARHQGANRRVDIDLSGGSITTTGQQGYGVLGWHTGASGAIDIDIKNTIVKTSGFNAFGVIGVNQGAGTVSVNVDIEGGVVETTGFPSHAVRASQGGQGDVALVLKDTTVRTTNAGTAHGAVAQHTGATGNLRLDVQGGSVETFGLHSFAVFGSARNTTGDARVSVADASVTTRGRFARAIVGRHQGAGVLAVDVSGATTVTAEGEGGIGVEAFSRGSGAIELEVGADVAIEAPFANGIVGRRAAPGLPMAAPGRMVVTHRGDVRARNVGVLAWVQSMSGSTFGDGESAAETAADEPAIHVISSGDVTVGAGVMDAYIRAAVAGDDEMLQAGEQAVLDAIVAGDSEALETALAALPDAYGDVWQTRARGFLAARALSPTDRFSWTGGVVPTDPTRRMVDEAAAEIAGLSHAGIRAMALSHLAVVNHIRVGDEDPAIVASVATITAIDEADRTPQQRATLAMQQETLATQRMLSPAERAVLAAALTGGDLDAALAALPATYTEAWKDEVRRRAAGYNVGDIRVDVTGGTIASDGDGVDARYVLAHDRNGAIAVTVADGAEIAGERHGLYLGGAGLAAGNGNLRDQTATVNGMVMGGTGAGVHLAGGGTVTVGETGRIGATSGVGVLSDGAGDLVATVAGRVEGDILGRGAGDHMVTVAEGGTVTGTIHLAASTVAVAGTAGQVRLDRGGEVTVAAGGRIAGIEGVAIRSASSDLTATVAGTVAGDILGQGEGTHRVTVAQAGAVAGDILAQGGDLVATVAGEMEGDLRAQGGALTATITGRIAGDLIGEGALTATVSGQVAGDILGRGEGDHMVTVAAGGSVTGTIHLAGSTVTVGGTVGRVTLDNSGMVTVGQMGRITGVPNGGHGIQVGAGSTVTNRGTITGTIGIQTGTGSTVVNYGTIRSTDGDAGIAVDFPDAGANTLTLHQGSIIRGKIRGLTDDDKVDLSNLDEGEVGILTFVDATNTPVAPGNVVRPRGAERFINAGSVVIGDLNTTAFALTDDMLSDLTGSIHAAVVGTGLAASAREGTPAHGHVWATPFGGARNQDGADTLTDGTHYFGGGLFGAGWGGDVLRVGVFAGGSTGRLDVDNVQDVDVQTIFGGAYAQQMLGDLRLDARLLMGHIEHDSARRVPHSTATAKYTAIFFSPEVGFATHLPVTDTLHATPRLHVRYAGLFTEGFRERAPGTNWDLHFAKRTVQILEVRGEIGVPIPLEGGGWLAPRVGLEGRWLLTGEIVEATVPGGAFRVAAGGDTGVGTGTAGFGLTLPVAEATTLVGNFDGALTTEHAWRATGYLGLTYSF